MHPPFRLFLPRRSLLTAALGFLMATTAFSQTPDPAYFSVVYPPENPYSAEKEILGKILFWDEQLGADGTMACGTCHRGNAGGSDPRGSASVPSHPGNDGIWGNADDVSGSFGVVRHDVSGAFIDDGVFFPNVQVTGRKAPPFTDAMFATRLFWDGRAGSTFTDPELGQVAILLGGALESQAVGPPLSPSEMACETQSFQNIDARLAVAKPLRLATNIPVDMVTAIGLHPTYPDLFNSAFGTPVINAKRIAFAIATYERSLTSDQTPWDNYNAGNTAALTPEQVSGLNIFKTTGRCDICHHFPLLTDNTFHNIGLVDEILDPGRAAITNNPFHAGAFKTPTLRNVGLREAGGLFHTGTGDGATLEDVVIFYETGGTFLNNIDVEMQALTLTSVERADLVDFVRNALTDPRVQAEAYPFDRPTLFSERQVSSTTANPRRLLGTGIANNAGVVPEMIALQPPYLGNPVFTVGLAQTTGGTVAGLAIGPGTGGLLLGGVSTVVDPGPAWIQTVFPLQGVFPTQDAGWTSLTLPIPDVASLIGYSTHMQWFCHDPNALFGVTTTDAIEITILQ